ncbi:prepilin-type N-terminal cleavage/methylation domain-containing protein [Fluoribacter gormanii]|uniref:prepilin-type N-terminal cleavage/methylation domain-containing protein n=1 Tax=Fluoribacter gormanii TaxID=464 RepID=UPI0010419C51|nr:prepilin-type N-terminal cleavage/methylation domain-containing protein [Fluoribacter gormanii]
MSLITIKKHKGYTLLEILIGIGIGLFLLGGSIAIYISLMRSFYSVMAVNRLDQQLRSAMNMMVIEIRRAGYSANAANDIGTGTITNPFIASANDIIVPVSSCILFTYDTDSNGTMPSLNSAGYDKRFGFRLSNNALQARAATDSFFDCNNGNWINLTDPNQIQVTNLSFNLIPTVITLSNGVSTLTIRNVTINLTGSLISDNSVSRTFTQVIRVRNDKFQP